MTLPVTSAGISKILLFIYLPHFNLNKIVNIGTSILIYIRYKHKKAYDIVKLELSIYFKRLRTDPLTIQKAIFTHSVNILLFKKKKDKNLLRRLLWLISVRPV